MTCLFFSHILLLVRSQPCMPRGHSSAGAAVVAASAAATAAATAAAVAVAPAVVGFSGSAASVFTTQILTFAFAFSFTPSFHSHSLRGLFVFPTLIIIGIALVPATLSSIPAAASLVPTSALVVALIPTSALPSLVVALPLVVAAAPAACACTACFTTAFPLIVAAPRWSSTSSGSPTACAGAFVRLSAVDHVLRVRLILVVVGHFYA